MTFLPAAIEASRISIPRDRINNLLTRSPQLAEFRSTSTGPLARIVKERPIIYVGGPQS